MCDLFSVNSETVANINVFIFFFFNSDIQLMFFQPPVKAESSTISKSTTSIATRSSTSNLSSSSQSSGSLSSLDSQASYSSACTLTADNEQNLADLDDEEDEEEDDEVGCNNIQDSNLQTCMTPPASVKKTSTKCQPDTNQSIHACVDPPYRAGITSATLWADKRWQDERCRTMAKGFFTIVWWCGFGYIHKPISNDCFFCVSQFDWWCRWLYTTCCPVGYQLYPCWPSRFA